MATNDEKVKKLFQRINKLDSKSKQEFMQVLKSHYESTERESKEAYKLAHYMLAYDKSSYQFRTNQFAFSAI